MNHLFMNRLFTLTMILASMTVFSGWQCGESYTQDPGFDMWCGEELCAWEVVEGEINRVPTWHRSDWGVEMLEDPVEITQLSEKTNLDVGCFYFEMLADRDETVEIILQMDFMDDGVIEYEHPIPSNNFRPAEYYINPPTWFENVRFTIIKQGPGRAVLAQLKATNGGDNCHGDPLSLLNRPDGAACEDSLQCTSGRCVEVMQWRPDVDDSDVMACSNCVNTYDCLGGQVCGLEGGQDSWMYRSCGPVQRHGLGERCMDHPECATELCYEGVCSECFTDVDCPAGSTCKLRDWQTLGEDYEFQILPLQCAPGEGRGVIGAVCLKNDDCESSLCAGDGELKQCFLDGRKCDMDEECPLWNVCLPLGVAGGVCQ